jgi:hypothetical protein
MVKEQIYEGCEVKACLKQAGAPLQKRVTFIEVR